MCCLQIRCFISGGAVSILIGLFTDDGLLFKPSVSYQTKKSIFFASFSHSIINKLAVKFILYSSWPRFFFCSTLVCNCKQHFNLNSFKSSINVSFFVRIKSWSTKVYVCCSLIECILHTDEDTATIFAVTDA